MRKFNRITTCIICLSMILGSFSFSANAASLKPTLKNDPINGQILPFYEVWLRWHDVTDEVHYQMSIRDLNTNVLIYDNTYIAKDSTYFVVPTSVLTRGHKYRWCVSTINSAGTRTCATSQHFTIENYNPDMHMLTHSFPSRTMEYFIYATSNGYDDILDNAAQSWNGIANVNLVRTGTPSDGKYEIGIYESPSPDNPAAFGLTISSTSASSIVYSEVQTYRQNIYNYYNGGFASNFYIQDYTSYFTANALHEVGHALGLLHTCSDSGYNISYSTEDGSLIPLIMNSGRNLGYSLNVVDRDHLRLKWGA